ncbi:alpha/beta hydrolase [Streptomyces sp. NPDC005562]|uniref:alpha/beta hydrolase n=1 Tax=Streptomyces sp. NPDC005562 TaxID=3154890 RepID=UPI0033B99D59
MNYETLKAIRPAKFSDAADGYRALGDMAREARDRVDNHIIVTMRKAQVGAAADAANSELRALARNFHYTQVECGLVSVALNGFSYDLESAKRHLTEAVEEAQAEKFTVNPDGSVSYPPGGKKTGGDLPEGGTAKGTTDETASAINRQAAGWDPNPNFGRAQAYADRIAAALAAATEADEKWAPKLRALQADDDLTVSDKDWGDARRDADGALKAAETYLKTIEAPPKDGSAKDNAHWWKGLTQEQRADYLALHPAAVGAMDGVPSDARDEANRTVFAETRAQYRMELDSIPPMPSERIVRDAAGRPVAPNQDWIEWNEKYGVRYKHLTDRLEGMDAVKSRLNSTGKDGLPQAYLLGFDPEGRGDGKVVIANGNPDRAHHTAVYVPGTGASLDGISGDLARSDDLWKESARQAPGQHVSTIMWFDYDAPRSAVPTEKGDIIPEATNDKYAREGGPVLREFLEGTRAAHHSVSGPDNPGHTTVIGHSYGSTLIGDAAKAGSERYGPLAADDVLVAGSPGMQAARAADLGIKDGHMWAMAAATRDDQVPLGGKFVGLGGDKVVPTDPEFGANIMETDSTSHSGYWDVDKAGNASTSLRNQARVIVGDYKGVTLE